MAGHAQLVRQGPGWSELLRDPPASNIHGGGNGALPGLADARKRQRELADYLEGGILLGRDHAELCQHDPVDPTQRGKIPIGTFLDRNESPPSAFGEQPDERISLGWQLDAGTQPVP